MQRLVNGLFWFVLHMVIKTDNEPGLVIKARQKVGLTRNAHCRNTRRAVPGISTPFLYVARYKAGVNIFLSLLLLSYYLKKTTTTTLQEKERETLL